MSRKNYETLEYEDKFDEAIKIKSNSYFAKEINTSKIPSDYLAHNHFKIINSNDFNTAYVVSVLFDIYYPDKPFYCIFNPTDKEIQIDRINFKIDFIFQTDNSNLNKDLLFIKANGNHIDKIKSLRVQSKKANGIDIEFEKKYKIEAKSSLTLNLPLEPSEGLSQFKHLFISRSRFARLGLQVTSFDRNQVVLFNSSGAKINLGDRFFQLVLPAPFSFDLNLYQLKDIFGKFDFELAHMSSTERKKKDCI